MDQTTDDSMIKTMRAPQSIETIGHWSSYGVFIVSFEHISHRVLEFLMLTLSR